MTEKTPIDPETCTEGFIWRMNHDYSHGRIIWRMTHDYSHGRIPEEDWVGILVDMTRLQKEQQEAVAFTSRFGVPKPVLDDKGRARAEYWQWYRHWNTWKKEMSSGQWQKINAARGDVPRELLPQTDWRGNPVTWNTER